jgi:hypothetical protein
MMDLPGLRPVDQGAYFIDPDLDPSTSLRVVYEIAAEGWSQWAGWSADSPQQDLAELRAVLDSIRIEP